MRTITIDPGSKQSGFVINDVDDMRVINHGIIDNNRLAGMIEMRHEEDVMLVEYSKAYVMASKTASFFPQQVLDTAVWIGQFIQAFSGPDRINVEFVDRRDVKMYLCRSARAKDSHVTEAVIARYECRDMREAKGTKAAPGPLYGVKGDVWQALGVFITWRETNHPEYKFSDAYA